MIRLENLGISKKRLEEWNIQIEQSLQLDENFVTCVTNSFFERYAADSIEEAVEKLTNSLLPVVYRVFVKRVIPPFHVDVEASLWRSPKEFYPIPRRKISHRFPWVHAPNTTIFEIYRELYQPVELLFGHPKNHVRRIMLQAGGETPERAIENYHSLAHDLRRLVRECQAEWPDEARDHS